MTLPTRADINVHDSLDERAACDNFLGKTLEEAEALFAENALYYQEALMHMGPAAFRFYVEAAIRYIRATHDDAMVFAFAGVLECRLEFDRPEMVPIASRLAAICRYILEHSAECGIPQTRAEIEAEAQMLRNVMRSFDVDDVLGKDFNAERFVDLRRRYEVLRDAILQMLEENRTT